MKTSIPLAPAIYRQWLFTMVLGLTVLLSSCSSEKAGLDKLRELCEKDAGLTINKTVEAEGYYDATRKSGALGLLVPSEFTFSEYCNLEPNIASLFDEPGCWRLTKVSRETNQCSEKVDKILWRFARNGYSAFREKNCIAVEKIEKPTARYGYYSDLKSWTAKNGVSEFIRSYALFKEVKSDDILSEYISYSYNKKPRHTSPISCHSLDERYSVSIKTDFIEKTIVSHKEK